MARTFSTGVEVPTSGDRHPSEAWWARMGATVNEAILRKTQEAIAAVARDYVPRSEATQYGIPGPASKISIGTVSVGAKASASMTGTAPNQTLNLVYEPGPRGPEGPGGSYREKESQYEGLFIGDTTPVAPWDPAWNRGIVPAGTDLNTLRTADHAGVWELSATGGYVNTPFTGPGQLFVTVARTSARQVATRSSGGKETWSRDSSSSSGWWAWESTPVQQPADGINLDNERANKDFMIRNATAANAVTGGWPDALGIPRNAASVSVRVTTTGLVFQTMQTYGADPRLLIRSTASTSPSPYPFSEWKDVTAPPAPVTTGAVPLGVHAGVANAVLLQDFTRRRPVVKTAGKPVVTLRFDHGLANFNTMVVPHLKRLNLPAAISLNAGDWARTENNGVTKEMVNTWVGEGWLEIWNHALNHVDVTDPEKFQEQIVTGLTQLRADLPAATIDGFMPVGSGPYIDFNGGNTVESWWSTDAGRLILQHHAVASGYIPGTVYRVLDGQPRQGQGHFTVDTMTLDDMQVRVEGAYSPVRGVQLMLHPSRLDTTGYLTSADYVEFLEWVAAERDDGRLVVLGAYDMLRADAST